MMQFSPSSDLEDDPIMDPSLSILTAKGTENHEKYIRNVCRGNKRALGLETVYITKSKREKRGL